MALIPICPLDASPLADVRVDVRLRGEPISEFSGYLCSKCRTIWSATKIDAGVDMRMVT